MWPRKRGHEHRLLLLYDRRVKLVSMTGTSSKNEIQEQVQRWEGKRKTSVWTDCRGGKGSRGGEKRDTKLKETVKCEWIMTMMIMKSSAERPHAARCNRRDCWTDLLVESLSRTGVYDWEETEIYVCSDWDPSFCIGQGYWLVLAICVCWSWAITETHHSRWSLRPIGGHNKCSVRSESWIMVHSWRGTLS